MANQIKLVATIAPANTAVEASTDSGATYRAVAMSTVGSQQEGILTNVTAGTYAAGAVKLRAVAFPAVLVSNSAALTVLAAATATTDAPIGYILGQSNAQGLGPISGLTAVQKGPFANVIIWNPFTQVGESLQVNVNELGLNGADLAALGYPGYEDGFGVETRYAANWQRDFPNTPFYLMKYGGVVTSTQGASIELFQSELLNNYKVQVANFKAWITAQGKTPRSAWLYWNQGEANNASTDYDVKLAALMTRCRNEFAGATTPFFIQEVPATSATIQGVQRNYAAATANTYLLPKDGISLLPDVTHYNTAGMLLAGDRLYSGTQNPVALPPSGTVDAAPAGSALALVFEPRQAGILFAGGVYARGSSTLLVDANSTGLATHYSPINTTTAISFRYVSAANNAGSIAFGSTYARATLQASDYAMYVDAATNTVQFLRAGTPAGAPAIPATAGRYYRLLRGGNTGTIKGQESIDNVAWTTIYTFATPSTAALYVRSNHAPGSIEQPQIQGGSQVLIAAAGPGLIVPGTGFAAAVGAATTTTAFTAWVYYTPSQMPTDFQVLLYKGNRDDNSEAFQVALAADGTLNGRTHLANNAYPSPASLPSGLAVNVGRLVLYQSDGTTARLFVNGAFASVATGGVPAVNSLPFMAGSSAKVNGELSFPAHGALQNMGWANRMLSDAEIQSLAAGNGLPSAALAGDAALTVATTLTRTYVSDVTTPNTAAPAQPVEIHSGAF